MSPKLAKTVAIFAGALALATPAGAATSRTHRLVQAINRVRADYHLRPLHVSAALSGFAQRHSDAMARTHVLAHALPLRFPIRTHAVGEDLAWVPGDGAAAIVAAWMASPPHRANLLSPVFRRIGVGDAAGLVTADFAA